MPKIIIFDLDETLFKATWEQYPPYNLSQSGEVSLSRSTKGIANKRDEIQSISKVTAIERERMKKIFDDVYEISQQAEAQGKESPIAIKVMTAGVYKEEYIKEIFDQFYGEDDNRFTNNSFPIEYFNKHNFDQQVFDDFRRFKRSGDRTSNNPLYNQFMSTTGKMMDPCKAKLIESNFEKWSKEMPNLEKSDIVLVDNAMYNVYGVENAGYKFLHYPTTEHEREEGQSFTREKEVAFEELHSMVESAKQELESSKQTKLK